MAKKGLHFKSCSIMLHPPKAQKMGEKSKLSPSILDVDFKKQCST